MVGADPPMLRPPALPATWDDLVAVSDDLDRFCSSSAWSSAAHLAFGRQAPLVCLAGAGAAVALAATTVNGRGALCGLDPMWGFSCPMVGADLDLGAALVAELLRRRRGRWQVALLSGFVAGSGREVAVVERLGRRHRLLAGPSITRRVADLSGGADAWLARRGPRFRRNLRRAERAAAAAGLVLEGARGGPGLVDRAAAVDRHSWKGAVGSGLDTPEMAGFYRAIAAALGPLDRMRATFARIDGEDVGFVLGAVGTPTHRACPTYGTYRGFQLAHHEGVSHLSVGNLLQWHQIGTLAAEGVARYDLGMDMAYKLAWADGHLTTRTLVVLP